MKKICFVLFVCMFLNAYTIKEGVSAYKEKNYKKAEKIFKTLINKSPQAVNNLAMMYYYGEIKDKNGLYNQKKAVELLKKGIKQFPNVAQLYYNLGVIYHNGYVESKDSRFRIVVKRKEAKNMFEKAEKLGYKKAKKFIQLYYNRDVNKTKKLNK